MGEQKHEQPQRAKRPRRHRPQQQRVEQCMPEEQADRNKRRRRASRFDSPAIRVLVLIHPTTGRTNGDYGAKVMERTHDLVLRGGVGHSAKCTLTEVTGAEVTAGALRGADVLYVPGGSVAAQQRVLGVEGYAAVVAFVRGGGGFVGICAGALLAGWGVDGLSGILGATTDWTGWTEARIATVALTEVGRQVLGGGYWSGSGGWVGAATAGERERNAPKRAAVATAVAAEEASSSHDIELVLTGGSWHEPAETHALAVEKAGLPPAAIAPFEPLCVLRRICKPDGTEVSPACWGAAAPAVAGCCGRGRVVVLGPHPESKRSDKSAHRWLGEAIYWASGKGIQDQ